MDMVEKMQAHEQENTNKSGGISKKPKTKKWSDEKRAQFTQTATIIASSVALLTSISGIALFGVVESQIGELRRNQGNYGGFVSDFTDGDATTIDQVVQKVAPSVVSIVTKTKTSTRYFGDQSSSASGSGLVVSADGLILTNKHVVEGGTSFTVYLDDGRSFSDVKLAATDSMNDIAFLKISDVSDLPVAELGDSRTLRAGQSVIAIGNALGQYQNTVTSGIISGMGRSIQASDSSYSSPVETLTDMIQTDASINPGNSGGPLVNAAGQVVGINTAVSMDANGIGFAIPIGAVKGMLSSLITNGTAQRAYIGVQYVEITPDVASEYDLPVSSGAYVFVKDGSAVIAGGPAEKAGVKNGDIITAVAGQKVGLVGGLSTLVAEHSVGDTIDLTLLRGDQELTISIELESRS